jgi:hypothetical protein
MACNDWHAVAGNGWHVWEWLTGAAWHAMTGMQWLAMAGMSGSGCEWQAMDTRETQSQASQLQACLLIHTKWKKQGVSKNKKSGG